MTASNDACGLAIHLAMVIGGVVNGKYQCETEFFGKSGTIVRSHPDFAVLTNCEGLIDCVVSEGILEGCHQKLRQAKRGYQQAEPLDWDCIMNRSRRPGPRRTRRRLLAERFEPRLLLATFVVQNTLDSGLGSLRQAIMNSNATPGSAANTISFDITPTAASYTINLLSALPAISYPVLIDGAPQAGYNGPPIVEINGGNLSGQNGLTLAPGSDGSTIEYLDITDFQDPSYTTGAGIEIESSNNLVEYNYLGPDLTGKSAGPGNSQGNLYGILISGGSSNTIGGSVTGAGNLLSADLQAGLLIADGIQSAEHNLVIGNDIGTDLTGSVALGNQGDGIELFASKNTIGGTSSGELNVISGNSDWGINIGANDYTSNSAPAFDNLIQGNYIGTDVTGTIALANGIDGVTDNNDSGNTIGSPVAGGGNLISANGGEGISLYGVSNDVIAGNLIGTTPGQIADPSSQFKPLGNSYDGIGLFTGDTSGSKYNTIGLPGWGNLIVANGGYGINLSSGSADNLVSGNAVGTTLATGSSIGIGPPVNLGNASGGINLSQTSGNTIGGVNAVSQGAFTQFAGNVSSGNGGGSGISIAGNDSTVAGGNLVIGNLLGTSADGSRAVSNGFDGITISNSSGNTVGGANTLNADGSFASMTGNLLSGNLGDGIDVNSGQSTDNLIEGNRIGTNLGGTGAIPNSLEGALIEAGPSNNTLGAANLDGSTANLISGNAESGVEIQGEGTTNNVVLGNRIGLAAGGSATLPNLGDGVLLNAAGNVIGGTARAQVTSSRATSEWELRSRIPSALQPRSAPTATRSRATSSEWPPAGSPPAWATSRAASRLTAPRSPRSVV